MIKIMEALNIKPSSRLNMSDRRTVVRALTNFLNDENKVSEPNFEQKLDRVAQIEVDYYRKSRESMGRPKREEMNHGGARLRDGGEERRDIPGIQKTEVEEEPLIGAVAAPPHHQFDP